MKESLVYLEISSYGYDQIRPWKNTDVAAERRSRLRGRGIRGNNACVEPDGRETNQGEGLGQNEYIPAKIKIIDYEIDLALIELEPNAMKKPLKPIKFADKFQRGAKLNYYWLNSAGELTTGQGYLDRAEVHHSTVSYTSFLNLIVTNTSQETGIGQVYCDGTTPIGIACWSEDTSETGLIPAGDNQQFPGEGERANYPGCAGGRFCGR